ncbi:protein-associating with the carboxyl-terminal domain of ezrin isoform X1 [Rhagoletis pomonella]|uniref:protein-associating with the carboxyl-terminal domain of ezrin isoform X1 n=1 Tax=Rhagoletis pomonella TaxID=28610 RepID=UPI0017843643|nr:protein-associating with the carboxyl-terminal domain of ezrin isoform X1 [Rhagoletis pomonella]
MGNDSSRLKGLVIDKNSVEANDFWTLYNAESPTTSNEDGRQLLSVFQGEPVVNGQLWVTQGPLERAIKNLMIYRHPYILKYVSTWEQGGQKHLATERVRPLTSVLSTQNNLQVCLGLRTILCSLIFLVEKALGRHLNICISSIYITDDGSWRLAGFEYVWKNKEITKTLLDFVKTYRYPKAVDSGECKDNTIDAVEQYAFATLCEEVLNKCSKKETTETPHSQEFRDYCSTHLKHNNAHLRPRLSAVLLHPYFNHEFVLIHSFLFELPLKCLQEKQDFFTGLIDRLRYFHEEVVGAQLAADLLSRMVLLDPTAQLCVTPYVLKTKIDHSAALFSNPTYVRYVMPHIKKMFRLRDAQIRLILLEYFMEFVRLLSKDEIMECILPYLQEGMNDTNDVLVAKTLRCMADLVPILGASTVIVGNRTRIFSDGRPQAAVSDATTHWVEPRSITPVMGNNIDYMVSDSPLPDHVDLSGSFNSLPQVGTNEEQGMPPRLSPDGGEDDKSTSVRDGMGSLNPSQQHEEIGRQSDNETVAAEAIVANSREATYILTPNIDENTNETEKICSAEISQIITGIENPIVNGFHNRNLAENSDDDEIEAWSDWESDELQKLNQAAAVDKSPAKIDESKVFLITNTNNLTSQSPSFTLPECSTEVNNVSTKTKPSAETSKLQILETTIKGDLNSTAASTHQTRALKINDDLNAFDIVVHKTATPQVDGIIDFDFFKDMEPIIEPSTSKLSLAGTLVTKMPSNTMKLPNKDDNDEIIIDSSRFAAVAINADDNTGGGDGWGMDDDVSEAWRE